MPAARMAVISLSAAIRLSPSNTPTSTAIGMVMVKLLGRVKRKISPTLASEALSRTTTPEDIRQRAHKENEGEQRATDEGVRDHFTQDVASLGCARQSACR